MRKFISVLFLLNIILAGFAQDEVPVLKVSQTSSESNIELASILSIKFVGQNMVVNTKDGQSQSFALADVQLMTFDKATVQAIQSVFPDVNQSSAYCITDLSGKPVVKGSLADQDSLPALQGIYIVTIGNSSKVVVFK